MLRIHLHLVVVLILFFQPITGKGQAPDLGTTSVFALFTAVGAFSNDGATVVTGDIGTNVGAFTGFPPGIVIGQSHVADPQSAQAASDVATAYMDLEGVSCGQVIGTTLGNNQVLTPDIYCLGAASDLSGNLILDGQGDPNSLFIFKIDGALSTSTFSMVTLINSASLCNVYWQVNGAFTLGESSVFRGTLIANGAIHLLEGSSLFGRGLSTSGAIDLHNNVVTVFLPPTATVIVAEGPTTFCAGGSVTLSGNINGIWSNGSTSPSIVVTASGDYFVTNTNSCGSVISNHIIVTVNPLPVSLITCDGSLCAGQTVQLCAPLGGASYVWSTGATTHCTLVSQAGIYIVTVTSVNGCTSIGSLTVVVNPLPNCAISGDNFFCAGQSTQICAPLSSSYLWSTGAATQCITVSVNGTYALTIADVNGCISTCNIPVMQSTLPVPSVITANGPVSFCPGKSVTLSGNVGGVWNTGSGSPSIIVTMSGDYYVITSSACGSVTSNHIIVTVIPDIIPPVITCPANIIIECDESILPANTGIASATDNCTDTTFITYHDVIISGGCNESHTIIRTWRVMDAVGNFATCNQLINIIDSTPPVIFCPTVVNTIECGTVPNFGTATATDACDPLVSITFITNTVQGTCAGAFSLVRTWTATDNCGNSSTCARTINVHDNIAPVITCPIVVVQVECGSAPNFGIATATDECDPSVDITFSDVTIPGFCPQEYSVTRTWTATDDCGNSAQCTRTIVIEDNTAPVLTCGVPVSAIECGTPLDFGTPTVTDVCDANVNITFVDITNPGLCLQEYSVIRIWTATDGCGNTDVCSRTIFVEDNTAPVISCPVVVSPIECGLIPFFGNATALDFCDAFAAITFVTDSIPGSCALEYSLIRTWTATDACGNAASCSATIDVVRTIPPVINCPAVVSPIECGTPVTFGVATSTDLCDPGVVITFSDVTVPGICPQIMSITRTWLATDVCGNTSACSRTIVVEDTTPPVLNCAVVVSPIACENIPFFETPTVFDACDGIVDITFTDVTTAGLCTPDYSVTRTWIARDDCGNTSECSRTIVVEDNVAPVIICAVVISPIECGAIPDFGLPTVTDLCDGSVDVTFLDVTFPGFCPQEYSVTRTWIATDDCGNASQCSATIVVEDTTPPVLVCSVVESPIECGTLPFFATPTAIDACDASVDITFTDVTIPGQCPQEYSVTRTWVATDDCGNVSNCNLTILVVDNTSPLITCADVVSPIQCGTLPFFETPTVTDACDGTVDLTFTDITINGLCAESYTVTRTWLATDDCGNTSECSKTIVIVDTTPPVISCPVVVSPIECGIIPFFGIPTAIDACDGTVDITFTDVTLPGFCPQEYSITRTWLATDNCGNTAVCARTIIVEDNTPPVLSCPVVVTPVECGNELIFGTPVAIDACDGAVDITFADVKILGLCPQKYSVTRTWLATDDCGNTSTCSRTIYLEDHTPPVIMCPVLVSPVECGSPLVFGIPTAIDGCGGEVTIIFVDVTSQGSCPQEHTVTRTWLATDVCGNASTCSRSIIVEDNTPPVIICPVVVSPIACGVVPFFGIPVATDACDNAVNITFSDVTSPGTCPQEYSVTRTWRATDDCGNSSFCSRTIVVDDNTAPVINCPVVVSPIACGTIPFFGTATATDACDVSVAISFNDVTIQGTCPQEYMVRRTWLATDDCGNTSICSRTISVEDNIPPVIACPPGLTVQCAGQIPSPNPGVILSSDGCGGTVTVTFAGDVMSNQICNNHFTITRSYRTTDACGNSASCQQLITVFDMTPPTITCPASIVVTCASMVPPVNVGNITTVDNCGGAATVTFTGDVITNQICANRYIINRIYRATDGCGNFATCIQIITVSDNVAPSVTCPANITVQCAIQIPAPSVIGIVAFDNCGGAVTTSFVSDMITNQICINHFTVIRTYASTDACGNSTLCNQIITVFDTTAPSIICPSSLIVSCTDQIPPINTSGIVVADNCNGQATVTHVSDVITNQICANRYTLLRTYRASDACGYFATCTQVISVVDNIPPVISFTNPLFSGVGDTLFVQCYGQDPEWNLPVFDISSATAIDNCTGNVTITFSQTLANEGNCAVDGYIVLNQLVWTATDACGNSSSATAYLALIDTIPPVLHAIPEDISVSCDAIPAPPVLVYATDECLCACVILFTETLPSEGCRNGQVVVRSWTARDRCGNETTETQNITLQSVTGPSLQIIETELAGIHRDTILEYTCSRGGVPEWYQHLNAASVAISAACGTASISFESNTTVSNNCREAGFLSQQSFRWTAIDLCGNESTLTINARLMDDAAPVIIGVPEFACIDDPMLDEIDAEDDCGHAALRYWDIEIPNPCGSGSAIRRTYEAYDDCDNVSRDSVILIPNDQTSPLLEFINPLLLNLETGQIMAMNCAAHDQQMTLFGPQDVSVDGGCTAGVTVGFDEILMGLGDCTAGGNVALMQLVWTATDVCGNLSTVSALASIEDKTSPVFTNFIHDVTVSCNAILPVNTATDNCGGVTITTSDRYFYGDCIYEYYIERIVTATDPCGNTTSDFQTIHVGDGHGPVIEGVIEEICDDLTIPEVTAFDECAGVFVDVKMTQDTVEIACRGLVIERDWSAVDACGHVSLIRQYIIIGDTTAPSILVPTNSVIRKYLDAGYILIYTSQSDLIAQLDALDESSVFVTDDCDIEIIPVFTVDILFADSCVVDGYFQRRTYTWVVTDICGNEASITFTIDIMDDVPPVFSDIPNDTTIVCGPLPAAPEVSVTDTDQVVTIIFTESIGPLNAAGASVVIRQWIAIDECGNTTIATQHIDWIQDSHMLCEILLPDIIECNSHGVVILSEIAGGFGPYTYQWNIVGEKCFIQTGQGTPKITIYVGFTEVVVTLTLTDAFGCITVCSTTLDCLYSAGNGISVVKDAQIPEEEFNFILPALTDGVGNSTKDDLRKVNLWPNPANGSLNLSFESIIEGDVQFSFTNLLGQIRLSDRIRVYKGINGQMIDVTQLPEGSYLMQIMTEKEIHSKVVVILRNE